MCEREREDQYSGMPKTWPLPRREREREGKRGKEREREREERPESAGTIARRVHRRSESDADIFPLNIVCLFTLNLNLTLYLSLAYTFRIQKVSYCIGFLKTKT